MGARIRAARQAAGLTQEELALSSGVSRNQIVAVELGQRAISFERLYDLAGALGTSASDLLPEI